MLDYKIKELKKQIEPRENEIKVMKEQIQEVRALCDPLAFQACSSLLLHISLRGIKVLFLVPLCSLGVCGLHSTDDATGKALAQWRRAHSVEVKCSRIRPGIGCGLVLGPASTWVCQP